MTRRVACGLRVAAGNDRVNRVSGPVCEVGEREKCIFFIVIFQQGKIPCPGSTRQGRAGPGRRRAARGGRGSHALRKRTPREKNGGGCRRASVGVRTSFGFTARLAVGRRVVLNGAALPSPHPASQSSSPRHTSQTATPLRPHHPPGPRHPPACPSVALPLLCRRGVPRTLRRRRPQECDLLPPSIAASGGGGVSCSPCVCPRSSRCPHTSLWC